MEKSPIDQLEELVEEAEKTARMPHTMERAATEKLELSGFRRLSKKVIEYHRGHVTETVRVLNLVSRLQKAFGEIYSSKSTRDKEWFEGTFPKFRPALNALVLHLEKQ